MPPTSSLTSLTPCLSQYSTMPFATFPEIAGSMKFAVPICIAEAPARRNSIASVADEMPPSPMTGIFTAFATCQTMRNATGLTDIPGKVGAAPVQNIGAYGAEVKDTVYQVHTIDLATGKTKIFSNEECRFSYRNSIFKEFISQWTTHALSQLDDKSLPIGTRHALYMIFAVDFVLKKHGDLKLDYGNIRNYLISNNITNPTLQDVASTVRAIRAEKLPEVGVVGSVGSFFQNAIVSMEKYLEIKELYPEVPSYPVDNNFIKIPTGWLIDRAGWKGYRENHVGVWDKQALVLVHYGGGKPQEILDLMKKIQESVYNKFEIEIKPEVNII